METELSKNDQVLVQKHKGLMDMYLKGNITKEVYEIKKKMVSNIIII